MKFIAKTTYKVLSQIEIDALDMQEAHEIISHKTLREVLTNSTVEIIIEEIALKEVN